jgi:hypothetical protein
MTTLSGQLGAALEAVADTIADTPEFRVWIDSSYDPDASRTAEEEAAAHATAYARVLFFTELDAGYVLPAALIDFEPESGINRASTDSLNTWPNTEISIMFQAETTTSHDTALYEGIKAFADDVLGITGGMNKLSEEDTTGTYSQFVSISMEAGPIATDKRYGDDSDSFLWFWKVGLRS